ncbi:hypothetical protein LZ31DRAFT_341912 [Colletotrichum somersetense]|nr:hypothetical protein LZ31DRAFT_341912 [Colletotrichum somersetense]
MAALLVFGALSSRGGAVSNEGGSICNFALTSLFLRWSIGDCQLRFRFGIWFASSGFSTLVSDGLGRDGLGSDGILESCVPSLR